VIIQSICFLSIFTLSLLYLFASKLPMLWTYFWGFHWLLCLQLLLKYRQFKDFFWTLCSMQFYFQRGIVMETWGCCLFGFHSFQLFIWKFVSQDVKSDVLHLVGFKKGNLWVYDWSLMLMKWSHYGHKDWLDSNCIDCSSFLINNKFIVYVG